VPPFAERQTPSLAPPAARVDAYISAPPPVGAMAIAVHLTAGSPPATRVQAVFAAFDFQRPVSLAM